MLLAFRLSFLLRLCRLPFVFSSSERERESLKYTCRIVNFSCVFPLMSEYILLCDSPLISPSLLYGIHVNFVVLDAFVFGFRIIRTQMDARASGTHMPHVVCDCNQSHRCDQYTSTLAIFSWYSCAHIVIVRRTDTHNGSDSLPVIETRYNIIILCLLFIFIPFVSFHIRFVVYCPIRCVSCSSYIYILSVRFVHVCVASSLLSLLSICVVLCIGFQLLSPLLS